MQQNHTMIWSDCVGIIGRAPCHSNAPDVVWLALKPNTRQGQKCPNRLCSLQITICTSGWCGGNLQMFRTSTVRSLGKDYGVGTGQRPVSWSILSLIQTAHLQKDSYRRRVGMFMERCAGSVWYKHDNTAAPTTLPPPEEWKEKAAQKRTFGESWSCNKLQSNHEGSNRCCIFVVPLWRGERGDLHIFGPWLNLFCRLGSHIHITHTLTFTIQSNHISSPSTIVFHYPATALPVKVKIDVGEGEPIESALRRFKREVNKSGHLQDLRYKRYFENSQDLKKRKIVQARFRVRMERMNARRMRKQRT